MLSNDIFKFHHKFNHEMVLENRMPLLILIKLYQFTLLGLTSTNLFEPQMTATLHGSYVRDVRMCPNLPAHKDSNKENTSSHEEASATVEVKSSVVDWVEHTRGHKLSDRLKYTNQAEHLA